MSDGGPNQGSVDHQARGAHGVKRESWSGLATLVCLLCLLLVAQVLRDVVPESGADDTCSGSRRRSGVLPKGMGEQCTAAQYGSVHCCGYWYDAQGCGQGMQTRASERDDNAILANARSHGLLAVPLTLWAPPPGPTHR